MYWIRIGDQGDYQPVDDLDAVMHQLIPDAVLFEETSGICNLGDIVGVIAMDGFHYPGKWIGRIASSRGVGGNFFDAFLPMGRHVFEFNFR